MNWAQITPTLQVGDITSCGKSGATACIHIWRDDFAPVCSKGGHKRDMVINYKDGESLSDAVLEQIEAFVQKLSHDDVLLVHCHAGQTRSPTIAAYALCVGGHGDIFEAMRLVTKGLWQQRRLPANITHKPLLSMCQRLEGEK